MLKQEIEALLKVELGEYGYVMFLKPIRLSRKQLTRPEKYDAQFSRAIYWIGQLDTPKAYLVTNHYHPTNHQAASELYKNYLLCK